MKDWVRPLLLQALTQIQNSGFLPQGPLPAIVIDIPKDANFGDLSSNIAFLLAKIAKKSPAVCAEKILAALPTSDQIAKVTIAGAGFINFFLTDQVLQNNLLTILNSEQTYGRSQTGRGQRIHIEYVSSNPTGPLHVGHGRSAAYGASVANLLEHVGYAVHREYYVNDAGRQMNILALSVWLRYLQLKNAPIEFPENTYQGHYVKEIAATLEKIHGDQFLVSVNKLYQNWPQKITLEQNPDAYLDELISRAQTLLGSDHFATICEYALNVIEADMREDLTEFRVTYDLWFSEKELMHQGWVKKGIQKLTDSGYTYHQDDALWFRATTFGDDKDRVLIRANGQPTYFASDVAYHLHKFQQGYDHIIDVFGADHHGYVPRLKAFLQGLGEDLHKFTVLIVQFAVLYRGSEKVSMSTRTGEFITLRELRAEVGNDAARFFYILRKPEQHLDFDLELAKSQSSDNPVYYIQYAHARICRVFEQYIENFQHHWALPKDLTVIDQLSDPKERELLKHLANYPSLIEQAAANYEPHSLAYYLLELASQFHTYYNTHRFLVENVNCRDARLCLVRAIQRIIADGLQILGVSSPEKM